MNLEGALGSNRHFEWLAPWYDRLLSVKDPERIRELTRPPQDGRVLDAGGGTGRIGGLLRPFAAQVVVADVSLGMLEQAQAKGLQTVGAAAERLPFPANCFDVVIMVDALHHVAHQEQSAAELYRVLRPGGRLVIEEPDIARPLVKLVAVLEKLALMRSRFLSPQQIAGLFRAPGAQARVEKEGFNAWVVVEKAA